VAAEYLLLHHAGRKQGFALCILLVEELVIQRPSRIAFIGEMLTHGVEEDLIAEEHARLRRFMPLAESHRLGGAHIPRYVQAAVVKEDGAPAFVTKPDLRFFAGEMGRAEECLALCILIHEVVGDKAIDGLDAVAADIVAADAANMCHAGLLEGDEGVRRSCRHYHRAWVCVLAAGWMRLVIVAIDIVSRGGVAIDLLL